MELLVVVALLGLLLSLLLPAVQAAREAARRMICESNLKQTGLALLNFENHYREFPIGAVSDGYGGFGTSWWVDVLPHFEQGVISERFDLKSSSSGWVALNGRHGALVHNVVFPLMHCPSSPLEQLSTIGGFNVSTPSYVGISGASSHDGFNEDRVATCCIRNMTGEISAGGMLIPNRAVSAGAVADGLSKTFIVGEASSFAIDMKGKEQRIDGGFLVGWLTGTTAAGTPPEYNPVFAPPSWNITTVRHPLNSRSYELPGVSFDRGPNNPLISAHPGVVVMLRADGSAEALAEDLDVSLLKQMATRDDGG